VVFNPKRTRQVSVVESVAESVAVERPTSSARRCDHGSRAAPGGAFAVPRAVAQPPNAGGGSFFCVFMGRAQGMLGASRRRECLLAFPVL
jgi:hypothetical protein